MLQLTIILQKEVPDETAAQTLFDLVKTFIDSYPDVSITAQTSNEITETP